MENQSLSLLQEYQNSGSEQAFAGLVSQHVNLVYSAALRQVGEPDMAREICQLVFIKLSEKAHKLDSKTILSGWLCRTTRFICADHLKARYRREQREREYAMQSHQPESEADLWKTLSPCLDAALAELPVADQDLLALRFFEKKQFAGIGLELRINDAAAKMRVSRALEKLRKILAARGIALTFAALAALMMANTVGAVPPETLAPMLNQLKLSAHPPQPVRTRPLRGPLGGMVAMTSAILLLSLAGLLVHSSLKPPLKIVATQNATTQKPVAVSGAETSIADGLGTTGTGTSAGSPVTVNSGPALTPYVPREFSEDTDDLKFILEYVVAQLPHIRFGDGGGNLQPSQIGILGDSAFMSSEAAWMNGSSIMKRADKLEDLSGCPVILIALDDEDQIKAALAALADRSVVTIGLHTNFLALGGCVNFLTLDNVLNYGLNLDRAKAIGCHFSGVLTNAAAELFENGTQTCRFAARPGDDTELEFLENTRPFLPKGFTRRMKRLALSEARREAIVDAWKRYPAKDTSAGDAHAMRAAMQKQQKEIAALRNAGSTSPGAIKEITDKFEAGVNEGFSNAMNASLEYDSRIRETRPERLALLAPVLTPDELFGYRFLLDSEAGKVANLMRVINITPDELSRIAFVFDGHADPMINGNLSPETEAIFQRELGPERYAQYKAAYSPAGQELALVILKYSTPLAHRTFFGDHRLTPKRPY